MTDVVINKKNILLFGSTGLIGNFFLSLIDADKYNIYKIGRQSSDIFLDLSKDIDLTVFEKFSEGDIAIYLSAISAPQQCIDDFELSYQINVKGTSKIIQFLLDKGVYVFFASSDVVYGETENIVNEHSNIDPKNGYALMKYEIEKMFFHYDTFKIFRLSYVWSFENSFSNFLISSHKKNESIEVFDQFIRSIVDINDVILFLKKCCKDPNRINKITNVCGPEFISRLDLVAFISNLISIKYNVIHDDKDFFLYRPKKIFMKSLYFEETIEKKPESIFNVLDKIKDHI